MYEYEYKSAADKHWTSLFIIMSFVYAKLLVVVCVAYVISDVITHNIPLYYYEGFFTYLYGMSIFFLLYVFCFLLQESSCCGGEDVTETQLVQKTKKEKVKKPTPPPKEDLKAKEKERKKEEAKRKKDEKERLKKEKKEKAKDAKEQKEKEKKSKKQDKMEKFPRKMRDIVQQRAESPIRQVSQEQSSVAPAPPPAVPTSSAPPPPAPPVTASATTNSEDVEAAIVNAAPSAKVRKHRRKTTQNDHSHGSFFLRIGAIAFGLGTMVYTGLEFGAFFEIPFSSPCYMILQGVNPLLQMIFTFMQMYFIFMNARLNIHRFKVIARFGLMHVIATNICVWIRTLILEYLKEITMYHRRHFNDTEGSIFVAHMHAHNIRNANTVLGTHKRVPDPTAPTPPPPYFGRTTRFSYIAAPIVSTVKDFIRADSSSSSPPTATSHSVITTTAPTSTETAAITTENSKFFHWFFDDTTTSTTTPSTTTTPEVLLHNTTPANLIITTLTDVWHTISSTLTTSIIDSTNTDYTDSTSDYLTTKSYSFNTADAATVAAENITTTTTSTTEALFGTTTAILNSTKHNIFDALGELNTFDDTNSIFDANENYTGAESIDGIAPQALSAIGILQNSSNMSCGRINIMGTIVEESAPYLFPFIIEFSLIGAAVLYVMWKHIGRTPKYITQEDLEHRLEVMLSRRAVAMAQVQNQGRMDCVGASKGLFFGLLMLVGSLICLILFFVLIHHENLGLLAIYLADVSHCALMVLSIAAILIGFCRVRKLKFKTEEQSDLNDILLRVSAFGLFIYAVFSIIAGHLNAFTKEPNLLVMITGGLSVFQVILQLMFIADVSRRRVHLPEHDRTKPGRQIVTFLLICNIAMWIIYTFETQKVDANPVQLEFYGFLAWAIVQRVTLPLCIFHRFHSAVTLAEIWKTSYKARLE